MEKPTIEDLKHYFSNVKKVKCLSDGTVQEIDLSRKTYFTDYGAYTETSNDHLRDECCIWDYQKGYAIILEYVKPKMRFWFVSYTYTDFNTGTLGSGNLGICSENLNKNIVNLECFKQTPSALYKSVAITNFIEMSEEDYSQFWKKE